MFNRFSEELLKMLKIQFLLFFCFTWCSVQNCLAQYDAPLYTSYTTKVAREKMHERLIKNTINKNLSFPLTDSTEDKWQEAFDAIELMIYKTPFTETKINYAFDHADERSVEFQKSLVTVVYSVYPFKFKKEIEHLFFTTSDSKLFAICSEYLLAQNKDTSLHSSITKLLNEKFAEQSIADPVLYMLQLHIAEIKSNIDLKSKQVIKAILKNNFLPGQIIMYSVQRKNRNFSGLVLIRNGNGDFMRDSLGQIITIPQLARSLTNLPGYLKNGNTPQGIFLMDGFGVSMSSFIGPSANIQMGMPVETSIQKFLGDSSIADTVWTMDYYNRLIPEELRNYLPLYYSYYAGLAGRSEIIAHGTTVDPNYYLNQPYYPLTPSQGCLCTKEVWDGKRIESDQQKLVNALLQAGGAHGYCVVIELDDKQKAVTIEDVLPFLPQGK